MTFEDLEIAREALANARMKAKAAAKRITEEITRPAQEAVDNAVLEARASGATKVSIAACLGESRTTINERLARATGGFTTEEVEAVVQTQATPTYRIDGDMLEVNWRSYGPDHVTDFGTVEIAYDPDEDQYWFMNTDGDQNQVVDRLDTVFTGWYYHDAEQFVKNALTNGGTE